MNSKTSRTLQGVTPYDFPLRTASHFLQGSFRAAVPASTHSSTDCLSTDIETARAVRVGALSLPAIHFMLNQGLAIAGGDHLFSAIPNSTWPDELSSSDDEEQVGPLEDYTRWRNVDADIIRGSGIGRPRIDPSDEEH